MSSRIDVKLEGGEGLVRRLQAMDLNVKAELRGAVLAGAEIIRQVASSMAPGPHVETDVVRASASVVEVDIGPDADHWHYRFSETGAAPHEITGSPLAFEGRDGTVVTARVGHPGMAASPFLRPAHDANEGAATTEIGNKLKAAVER